MYMQIPSSCDIFVIFFEKITKNRLTSQIILFGLYYVDNIPSMWVKSYIETCTSLPFNLFIEFTILTQVLTNGNKAMHYPCYFRTFLLQVAHLKLRW